MTDRKKPGVAFWATVVLVALVLYVASFGPACWYAAYSVEKTGTAPSPWNGLLHYPLGQLTAHGPAIISVPLRSYAAMFVDKGTYLYLPIRWRKWDISVRR